MHCFDDAKAVIFVSALSDYDLNLIEGTVEIKMYCTTMKPQMFEVMNIPKLNYMSCRM